MTQQRNDSAAGRRTNLAPAGRDGRHTLEKDIVLAGVGGQGTLSIAFCICNAALRRGLNFKQAEVHGMAQRGGAVVSHLRLSTEQIYSDQIPLGEADLLLSVEPLEALRYVQYLRGHGAIVSSSSPFVNISNYPEPEALVRRLARVENHILVDSQRIAKATGSGRADNMAVLGAGAPLLGFTVEEFDEFIQQLFGDKSPRIVEINRQALRLGRTAAEHYQTHRQAGRDPVDALKRVDEQVLAPILEAAKSTA